MVIGGLALLANTFLLVALGFVRSRGKTSHHSLITSLCFGNILFCISVILYIVNKVIRSMKTAFNWKRKEWKFLHSNFVFLQHPEGTSKNLDKPNNSENSVNMGIYDNFFSIFKVKRRGSESHWDICKYNVICWWILSLKISIFTWFFSIMLCIKILQCLNVIRTSFIPSKITCNYILANYCSFLWTLKIEKKILIDTHVNTVVRIFCSCRFCRDGLMLLQGVQTVYQALPSR